MDVRFLRALCVTTVVLSSHVCLAAATRWADEVYSFLQPPGSSTTGGLPTAALGAPDGLFVSIDTPEELVLAFVDNRVRNGPGNDLRIYGAGASSSAEVYGRWSGGPCTFLGTVFGSGGEFDLANYPGLDYLDYVRFVGMDDDGQFQGYDLDAVEALNCLPRVPGCPIPAPGAILLTALGSGMLAAIRRRQVL